MKKVVTTLIVSSAISFVLLGQVRSAEATVVLDNSPPQRSTVWADGPDYNVSTYFTISQDSTITGFNWWGSNLPDPQVSVATWDLRFYGSHIENGLPHADAGNLIKQYSFATDDIARSSFTRTSAGITFSGTLNQYALPNTFQLQANTGYFVLLRPWFSAPFGGHYDWYISDYHDLGTIPQDSPAYAITDQKTFMNYNNITGHTLAWQLQGVAAVPEPEMYAMLGVGLGLIGCVTRRRKQAAE